MKTLLAYLRLMRPPNIVTAVADILAGWSIAIHFIGKNDIFFFDLQTYRLSFLILATIGLYGGGVVMNDVADYELDKIERPERPIPSGLASRMGATILGIGLLVSGIVCAWMVSLLAGEIASAVAILALLYDFFGKHHKFFGPLNMGICRGGNLLLGMCVTPYLNYVWPLAILPVIYIAAITMISRGEVVGGNKKAILLAGLIYLFVIAGLMVIALFIGHPKNIFIVDAFVLLFASLIYQPLFAAYTTPDPIHIRQAVKAGVISLIVMDAALSACMVDWKYALIVLVLLPISLLLAKAFAVT
ncbi:MAG TPA: UbiA-like protein EboC [Bacteroidia bacterium]|nr:UbiA-like protein EboC [Bacteroidia bacterium]